VPLVEGAYATEPKLKFFVNMIGFKERGTKKKSGNGELPEGTDYFF